MRTVRSNDNTKATMGYWEIFPEKILNDFERLTTFYYRLDAQLIMDDLPTGTDKVKLTEHFTEKLYKALQEDPSYGKRVDTLRLSCQRAYYDSFWKFSVVRNPKVYISLVFTITSAATALLTYLRLSQPTSASADVLSRYVQENTANITAKAFVLVSSAMKAANLTLPRDFLNTTLNNLTTEILNQSVVYLRQESQTSVYTSLLNIGVLAIGMTATVLAIMDRLVLQPEIVDKLDEERFTKLILPVHKCANKIAKELALKHSIVYRIINFFNDQSQKSVTKSKDKEDMHSSPLLEPVEHNMNDLEGASLQRNTQILAGRLLTEFDRTLTKDGYKQAEKYLNLCSPNTPGSVSKSFIFKILHSKISQKKLNDPNSLDDRRITVADLNDKEQISSIAEVFSSKEASLATELFELLDNRKNSNDLIDAICGWLESTSTKDKNAAIDKIANIAKQSKDELQREAQNIVKDDGQITALDVNNFVSYLLEPFDNHYGFGH